MLYQDYILTLLGFVFSYALVPQIVKGFKEKRGLISYQTSMIYAVGMLTIAIMYLTLRLYLSATLTFVVTALWTTLLIQRIYY